MGLPMYKPRDEDVVSEKHQPKDMMEDEFWSIFPHPLHNYGNTRRPSHRTNNTQQHSLGVNVNPRNFQPRVSRIARRRSMLTSSLLDRRRDSRVHQLPGSATTVTLSSSSSSSSSSSNTTPSTSPPMRSELDRRLHQRITEKEDLLEQLRVTVSLLDQFLSARATLGRDMSLPSFITEDLPAVLESASSLAAMSPSLLTSASSTVTDVTANNEVTTLQEMVDRLLQIPPYSVRIQYIEQSMLSAHRRIREQLSVLGSSTVGLQQNFVTPVERINNDMQVRRPVVGGEPQQQTDAAAAPPTTTTTTTTTTVVRERRALPAPRERRTLPRNGVPVDDEFHSRTNFVYGSHT